MKHIYIKYIYPTLLYVVAFSNNTTAQTLAVQADKYLQNFEGAGISAGLYMGHHYSMPSEASKDLAVRYIAKDLNMRYIQDYTDRFPADDTAYFDRRANYLKAAKAYRPDIQVSQVGNKFPASLMADSMIGGQLRKVLKTADPDIYNKIAGWYFELFKAFKTRGVDVDILNVVNEPDFDKVYYYGADGDTKRNVALIFEKAVTKFFAMLADPNINTFGIAKPKIMGPSTISPAGCVTYVKYFKTNYPQVWDMIDIVAYHQYVNGVNVNDLAQVKSEAGTKLLYQSEMHTNRGDNLGVLPISDSLRGCLSLASVFGNAMRTGTHSWFYFQTNYPNTYTPAGLLYIDWMAVNPYPYKHYYAFQQLTSTQPINSNVLEHVKASLPKVDVVCFRKQQTDSVYVNASNLEGTAQQITLSVDALTGKYNIEKYQVRSTTETRNNDAEAIQTFATPVSQIVLTLPAYSVNTITLAIKKEVTTNIPNAVVLGNQIKTYQTANSVTLQSSNNNIINGIQVINSAGQVIFKISGIKQPNYTWYHNKLAAGIYSFQIVTNKGLAVKKINYLP
jgi:O-glycosyl hydrolase